MKKQKLPKGWTQQRIKEVLAHYETQTEEEQLAEHEAAYKRKDQAMMAVPLELVPVVREIIAHKSRA